MGARRNPDRFAGGNGCRSSSVGNITVWVLIVGNDSTYATWHPRKVRTRRIVRELYTVFDVPNVTEFRVTTIYPRIENVDLHASTIGSKRVLFVPRPWYAIDCMRLIDSIEVPPTKVSDWVDL